jgi:large subunit ribosomal protein L21
LTETALSPKIRALQRDDKAESFTPNRLIRVKNFRNRNMYAVVQTGGKQYRLSVGDSVRVEKLAGEPGEVINLPEVLMVGDGEQVSVGSPTIEGACVKAEILAHGRDKKIRVFKMKRRKKYRRTQGHRQSFTQLRVTDITH